MRTDTSPGEAENYRNVASEVSLFGSVRCNDSAGSTAGPGESSGAVSIQQSVRAEETPFRFRMQHPQVNREIAYQQC